VVAALACLAVTACAGALPAKTIINNPIPIPSQTQLPGTALNSLLLPLSDFPAGTEVVAQDSSNSGPALLTDSQDPTYLPPDCQNSARNALTPASGFTAGAVQVLYDGALDHASSYHQRRFGQDVYQFATLSASNSFFNSVRSTIARCPSVTTATSVLKQTVSPASVLPGHRALLLWQTGTTKGVNVDAVLLVTIDGTDVYALGETVFGIPLASQPSDLASQTTKLIARVHTYECALACTTSGGGG
jgi:hypothetical protein